MPTVYLVWAFWGAVLVPAVGFAAVVFSWEALRRFLRF